MREKTEAEILHRMAAYCSLKECCVQDIQKKLSLAGLAEEAGQRIVSRLIHEKFIDEARFARAFVIDKLRFNKWGRVKIGYELRKKGVESTVIEDALSAIDEQEYLSILQELLKSKKKTVTGKDKQAVLNKLLRFAAGRGYESRDILSCLKKIDKGYVGEDCFE